MCSLKFRASTGIKGFNVFLTVDKKIPADVEDETKIEEVSKLRLLNKTSYNELILLDMSVCTDG